MGLAPPIRLHTQVSVGPAPPYNSELFVVVVIEDRDHPVTPSLPESFAVGDEWYEFDRSPRPNVRVPARADESTYQPNKPMGDRPLVWTNENYPRAFYSLDFRPALCNNSLSYDDVTIA